MAYDRDLTANPLRRLRGTVMGCKDIPDQLRKHLNQTIDAFIESCPDFFTQQAASTAIMARWMAMKCEGEMLALPASSPGFKLASLSFQKHSALANACFKLAKAGTPAASRRVKPPTRQSENTPHAQAS